MRRSLPNAFFLCVCVLGAAVGCARPPLEARLEAAWVAVRPDDEEVARVGPVELTAGEPFTLHSVVEARDWRGETFYFTEAPALEIDGEVVDGAALRRWNRRARVRTLWFSVEAFPPYAESSELTFRDVYRGDWPFAWSIPGDLAPSVENVLPDRPEARRDERFGTLRFKVRVEVLGPESEILPRQSLESWGARRLPEVVAEFPGVVATLAPPLALPSRVFGLAQREPSGPDRSTELGRVADWQRRGLAFSRLTLLRAWLNERGSELTDLPWTTVDLQADEPFATAGDLLRVGERIVWLYRDLGRPGRLDREDLCLDFERGARVRALADIFTGEGLVERARLTPPARTESSS